MFEFCCVDVICRRTSNSGGISPGRNPYVTSVQTSDLRHTRPHEHRTHHSDDRSNTRQPSASITNTSCPGGSHRLKICNSMVNTLTQHLTQHVEGYVWCVCVVNSQACPSRSRPIRELQCSVLNARSFMGRLYEWEPFSDGETQWDDFSLDVCVCVCIH